MANVKNITKKLVDAGYSEEKLILMTEKEIRETYKSYKSSPKEDDSILSSPNTTPENNDNTIGKEEITMRNEMIKEMKKLARKYDAFTHCIDDCRQREEAEKRNKVLDTKFVEIANKIGINATANDLYEIISNDYDSFDEAIETYIKYHEVKVVSTTLTQENGELTFVELSPEQKIQISAVLDAQLQQDVNYSSWFEEENGIFKLYGGWVDEDSVVEEEYYFDDTNKLIKVEKEESTMKNNTNTTVTNNSTNNKEVITMTNEMIKVTVKVEGLNEVLTHYGIELICSNHSDADTIAIGQTPSQYRKGIVAVIITQTPSQYRKGIATMTIREDVYKTIEKDLSIVSNNSTTSVEKEETTMRTTQELLNDALNISKIQDENYVTNAMLREEYKKLTGNVIGSKKTRPVIIKAIQDELSVVEEASTPEPETKEPAKTAPDDAKVLTYRLMHKIGDHALTNRKKGFGTTVSAWMLCAYILEVKYDIKKLKGHEHEITDEMKETVKNVRKWLIDNHYIETVTFKDENGFVFYTPEYDGNRKDKMYDCTKFQATGKVETTTYRVTKEMNKWYTK